MKFIAVIPAHLASVRFPNKILFDFFGLPMIEHVRRRALLSGYLSEVYVATCDKAIAEIVSSYGGKVIMTSNKHRNGTSRVAEAVLTYDCSHVLLLQGDEPQIFPEDLINLKTAFTSSRNKVINLVCPIEGEGVSDPNLVKVIMDSDSNILYFTRTSVPHNSTKAIRQLGMIGFTKDALAEYINLQATQLEELESIDMMRFIENDYQIKGVISSSLILGVDRPEDIQKVEIRMSQDSLVKTYKKK